MAKPEFEWEPSWNDDWLAVQDELEDMVEKEEPLNPEEAVEMYRYGFSMARRHPRRDWSDVESDLYQDYMSGAPEPRREDLEQTGWDRSREWAQRGWQAGRDG